MDQPFKDRKMEGEDASRIPQQQRHGEPFLCNACQSYLAGKKPNEEQNNHPSLIEPNEDEEVSVCSCCMGLWSLSSSSSTGSKLYESISKACEPYGGISAEYNQFSVKTNHVPTLTLSVDVSLRYQYYVSSTKSSSPYPFNVFIQDLKHHFQQKIHQIIVATNQEHVNREVFQRTSNQLEEEEQGYLSLHILCIPPKDMDPTLSGLNSNSKKRKRHGGRKRPFITQGGDPRINLETRLHSQGYHWVQQSEISNFGDVVPAAIAHNTRLEFHVACFRRPIFLYGYYTKCRRDVSQTPFIVPKDKTSYNRSGAKQEETTQNDDKNEDAQTSSSSSSKTKTLGVTSVEEEICNPIIQVLGGISTQNNSTPDSNVIYGMCKFHASGREDMDVRMLIKKDACSNHSGSKGRPFCVQFIDAFRPIQSIQQLTDIVHIINHTQPATLTMEEETADGVKRDTLLSTSTTWYGQNPLGVGISDDLHLVPSSAFSNLQSDTETKVKHYGCHCWSEKELPKLNVDDDSLNEFFFQSIQFPLTIHQKTPIRVLHRRPNLVRERQVLTANAIRIDAHHFRLELSAQAGTYIKEFVHGDLRRTEPSIASILNCKTNLLLLDCEGIDL